jgi:hypothetical protein
MPRAVYYVVSEGQNWRMRYGWQGADSQLFTTEFPTKSSAIRYAVDCAHTEGKKGNDAQVVIQDQSGKWQTEWTYGHDPYPPKG